MKCFETKEGLFAVIMRNERSSYLLTKFEIVLAIEKFGYYSITNVKRGEETVFFTNLPYQRYLQFKDKLR